MAIVDISYQRDPASGAIVFDASGYPIQNANPTANTFGQLQARIANEVLGSPTASDIQNAIWDAVAIYDGTTFHFNEMKYFSAPGSASSLTTVPGQEYYSDADLPLLMNYPHISKITIQAFGCNYPMVQRTNSWMDDISFSTTWQGLPTDWSMYGSSGLRLFPVPNGSYPLALNATIRLPPLLAATDFNAWTNAGERLIRLEAKRLLFTDIIRDQGQAMAMLSEIQGAPGMRGELGRLRAESLRRAGGPGRLRPSRGYF